MSKIVWASSKERHYRVKEFGERQALGAQENRRGFSFKNVAPV
ncbi:MAG TPA: hypothetical protein VM578_02640 [Candidatus Saccharimonadales bacterium]|nr:hypothetical protein [Candidatus Saccharimonadales bacterium]